ncbi:hypothetical protein [Thiofilum flexile]|uniref:hypothetical protein n=1 Tax=Thiofilum flexile TaxID=125627 RepID=UPI0003806A6F|nr:hypothetical protein [Thiofilum flexile]
MVEKLKIFLYKTASYFLIKISNFLYTVSNFLQFEALKIRRKIDARSESRDYLKEISIRPEILTATPDDAAASVQDKSLKNAVYLYFLTKQVVAIYESRINLLPLQVFNEMRNALDHYFRSLLTVGTAEENQNHKLSQIKKIEGHIHRSLLDVIKLTCSSIVRNIDRNSKLIGTTSLAYVDNGEFIKQLKKRAQVAESALCEAKVKEYEFGENPSKNKDVCDYYLVALLAHLDFDKYFKDNYGNIFWGKAKYLTWKTGGFLLTFLAGYLVRVFWAGSENTPIIQWFIKIINSIFNGKT